MLSIVGQPPPLLSTTCSSRRRLKCQSECHSPVAHLALAEDRHQRVEHGTDAVGGQQHHNDPPPDGHQHRDHVAGPDALAAQGCSGPRRQVTQFVVADAPGHRAVGPGRPPAPACRAWRQWQPPEIRRWSCPTTGPGPAPPARGPLDLICLSPSLPHPGRPHWWPIVGYRAT